jgi:predicted nucleotidyltransferase
MQVVTLKQRKDREAARRMRAVQEACIQLRDFAQAQGGRFIIYGSAACGTMRYDSDLDILIDVPETARIAAWDLVEQLATQYTLPTDIDEFRFTSPEFRAHFLKHAVVIE